MYNINIELFGKRGVNMPTLGTRISKSRKAANLTQQQVANHLNVVRTSVSHWESDLREPDLKTLKSLANLLGVSFEYLVGAQNATPLTQEQLTNTYSEITKNLGEDVQVMFHDITTFDEEELEKLKDYIEFIKSKKK